MDAGCSSERGTITTPVMTEDRQSMSDAAVRTLVRASETPVRRETTTNMFNGTRKRDDSYLQKSNTVSYLCEQRNGR